MYRNLMTQAIMKIKDNYKVRSIAGENLIVEQGKSQADMTKVISLNSTALLLWNALAGRDFTLADAADVLVEHFGIDQSVAAADVKHWVEKLQECGIIA